MRLSSLAIAASLSACTLFVPDRRTPVDRAREIEPKCGGFADAASAAIVAPDAVESVEAGYSYVKAGSLDRAARMRGAKLRLKPLAGATKESILRALACHEAGVALGRVPPHADDPYVANDRWLDIDVSSDGDGFVVFVQTDDLETARSVFERAKRFAASRAK